MREKPLIFTFRTKTEGGEKECSYEQYRELLIEVAKSKMATVIDVEVLHWEGIKALIQEIQREQIPVIGSNHDFLKTELLKTDKSAYSIDVNGNTDYDEYREINGDKWKMDKAYQMYTGDEPCDQYVLCKDNVIIKITSLQSEEDIDLILSRVFE